VLVVAGQTVVVDAKTALMLHGRAAAALSALSLGEMVAVGGEVDAAAASVSQIDES